MDEQSTTSAEAGLPDGASQPAQGPLNYANAAIGVVKLDTEMIVRVSRDPMALTFGAIVFVITSVLSIVLRSVLGGINPGPVALAIGPVIGLIASVITTGTVHILAKVMFQANGTLVGLLRVLWLGSFVSLLGVIPIAGAIAGGIWSLLIMMVTFQEVDGIERLQALGLSIVVSLFLSGFILATLLRVASLTS